MPNRFDPPRPAAEKPFPPRQEVPYLMRRAFEGPPRRNAPHCEHCPNCGTFDDPERPSSHCAECGASLLRTLREIDVWESECADCGATFEVCSLVGSLSPRPAHSKCRECRMKAREAKYLADGAAPAVAAERRGGGPMRPTEKKAAQRASCRRRSEARALRKAGRLDGPRIPRALRWLSPEAQQEQIAYYRQRDARREAKRLARVAAVAAAKTKAREAAAAAAKALEAARAREDAARKRAEAAQRAAALALRMGLGPDDFS